MPSPSPSSNVSRSGVALRAEGGRSASARDATRPAGGVPSMSRVALRGNAPTGSRNMSAGSGRFVRI